MVCVRIRLLVSQNLTRMSEIKSKTVFAHNQKQYLSTTSHCHCGMDPQAQARSKHETVLIVGLGNHGMDKTRHSVGMRFVDRLVTLLDISWSREKTVQGMVASRSFTLQDCTTKLLLMKPKAFMNVNGRSVAKAVHAYNPSQVYLVHDDLDKELGKFGLKQKGSARGHNGVRSVFASLRTDEIPRLRLGIGRPNNKEDVGDYVLENFASDEVSDIEEVIRQATWTLLKHIEQNVLDSSRQELVRQIKAAES